MEQKTLEFITLSSLSSERKTEIINDPSEFLSKNFLNTDINVLSLILNKDNVEDLYLLNGYQNRLLPFAVMCDRCDLIDFLLAIGANPNSTAELYGCSYEGKSIHHMTCLSIGCYSNNRSVIEKLLQGGADANYVPDPKVSRQGHVLDYFSITLLENASPRHPISHAIVANHIEYVDLLMAHGADINFENGNMYATPFHGMIDFLLSESQSSKSDNIEFYTERLNTFLDKGVSLSTLRHPYLTHFIIRCWFQKFAVAIVNCLLSRGIDPRLTYITYGSWYISPATDKRFFNPNDMYGNYEKIMEIKKEVSVFSCLNCYNFKIFRVLLDHRVPMRSINEMRKCQKILQQEDGASEERQYLQQLIDSKQSNYADLRF